MDALAEKLITKALDLGATAAGIANMGDLLSYSSHDGFPIATKADEQDSVLVVGLDHVALHEPRYSEEYYGLRGVAGFEPEMNLRM